MVLTGNPGQSGIDDIEVSDVTQDEIKSIMHYDPLTGECTRLRCTANRHVIGEKVGSLDRSTGYYRATLHRRKYWLHRLIWLYMTGDFPQKQMDHVNHDRTDNRFCNLRDVSQAYNMRNRNVPTSDDRHVIGVYKRPEGKSFSAEIANTKLGIYRSFFDAVCARKSAENKLNFHANHGKTAGEITND